ncbi:hypothetical protein [Streptomyces sp. A012304]|uniref:hypothetical protein n=1 Tax=Streptomyces sp. A012304 TaxID=375446 RepID=UPI002231FE75|nr:hypothetical protein [Streptomyces sp. A012304]GKQ37032.1 hypothetical protein ALMP_35710 [Streptomyces sp. A012304]
MKHRGRHRRRRQGKALRAFLAGTALALTAAATMISASQATVTGDPGALKPLASADTDALRLTAHPLAPSSLDRLSAAMGAPVGVDTVLGDARHTLRDAADCTAAERETLPVSPTATAAYCWKTEDTAGWRPGAVTTSGDADHDGRWGRHRVVLSAWSRGGGPAADRGLARVAFVDAGDPDRLAYTWALLAVPVDGGRDYRGLVSHVSGMVWYEDKLLVTADDGDRAALYVYDVNRIQRATVTGDAVGRVPGGWSAHGYRYVLPAVATYRLADGAGAPRPTALSLDRSTAPDSLVAAEWTRDDGDRGARLWRYAFDTRGTGLLADDGTGRVEATEAYSTKLTGVRGVLAYRDAWYLTRAAGPGDAHGTLWRQDTEGARPAVCAADDVRDCWSGRTESLSYAEATGEVWTQSDRVLFSLPLASVDRAAE